jgi:hypothetical protein
VNDTPQPCPICVKRFGRLCRFAVVATLALLASESASAREPTWQEQQNLPPWAQSIVAEQRFASTYALSTRINPYFLQGDFNGDSKPDLAVLIEHKTSAQQGIAILHAGASNPVIVGAGRSIGNGGADFSWLDAWSLHARQTVPPRAQDKKSPVLRGDALLVQKLESASALIYWDGATYRWHQQGD